MNPKLKSLFNLAMVLLILAAGNGCGTCRLTKNRHPLLPGLVASWPAEGNAKDLRDVENGKLSANGVTFVPSKVGMGFKFDGTNGYVEIRDSPELKPATVTVEAWVWFDPSAPPNHGGEAIIFKKTPGGLV